MTKYRNAKLVAIYERRLRIKLRRILNAGRGEPTVSYEEWLKEIAKL